MKIKKSNFREILELAALAEQSGEYPSTTLSGWISHIRYLFNRNQIIRVRIDGRVYAFLEFIRCNKQDLDKDELPDKPDPKGEVLYFPLAVSKIPGLLRKMFRKAIAMNPDVKFLAWHRRIGEKKDKLMITRTRNQFNFLKLKEAK